MSSRPSLKAHGLKRLSDADASLLMSRFSEIEVKEVVYGCGDDKAPGPDGFNFKFIKKFWSILSADFMNIMNDFYETGFISRGVGSSFITLIPKNSAPSRLGDYRPITLIGVTSKVISKVLANRLKKSDMLRQLGFPSRWCQWVEGILVSARSSVLVNGAPTFEFDCKKGIRQGDPLSPFLFVIVMEALSSLFKKASDIGVFDGMRLPNGGPEVNHFLYVDDAMVLGKWTNFNFNNLKRILRIFIYVRAFVLISINLHYTVWG
ncbi:uncharacterized protein LOC110892830 [Helianthus annuus]|uniref:uncharacterized protein LOC110892830 n=1 Tax=Helianthus annuus TaxID=4232 RepID=UPI000B8F4B78|nr:uncharacterized protein LOC110892830 [Helianthus annuus]